MKLGLNPMGATAENPFSLKLTFKIRGKGFLYGEIKKQNEDEHAKRKK